MGNTTSPQLEYCKVLPLKDAMLRRRNLKQGNNADFFKPAYSNKACILTADFLDCFIIRTCFHSPQSPKNRLAAVFTFFSFKFSFPCNRTLVFLLWFLSFTFLLACSRTLCNWQTKWNVEREAQHSNLQGRVVRGKPVINLSSFFPPMTLI